MLIGEIAAAIECGMSLEALSESIHAHPTLSEILMETAKNGAGQGVPQIV